MQLKIFKREFWRGQRLLLLAFLVLHTTAAFYYTASHNMTFDEPHYFEYAKRWLHGDPERIEPLDDSKSPIVAIAWAPRIVRQVIDPAYKLSDYGRKDQQEGRYMMIVFSFIAAWYVYRWSKALYGQKGWIMPLLLLLFDPLYLAYSTLILTDLACGAFLVALLYHFKNYVASHSRKDLVLSATFTGLAIVTKQTMLFVLLLLPVFVLFYSQFFTGKKFINRRLVLHAIQFFLIVIVVINSAYYFHGSFIPFGQYQFESSTLVSIKQNLPFLNNVPVPLPFPYVQSIDMLQAHAELGAGKPNSTYNGVYLFGELKQDGNFWYYYAVLLFYKLPIGTMVLFVAALILFIKRFSFASFVQHYQFLVIPAVYFFVILSFFNQFQTGIRHLLLIFPLFYIGIGYVFFQLQHAQKGLKVGAAILVAYSFISVACYYPYIIPYTNEFIVNKKTVYKKIYDSSIDYGQSDSAVKLILTRFPGLEKASPKPRAGKFVVPMGQVVNHYLGSKNLYNWYRQYEPVGHHRYTLLLYDISQEDLDKREKDKEPR